MTTNPAFLDSAVAGDPPASKRPTPDAAWHALREAACTPYRPGGRFAFHFARGKLGHDPVFRGMLERGDLPPRSRIVDIGCGQGLIASLCWAIDAAAARGGWPAGWPAAPTGCRYTGIELMPKDVARAQSAADRRGDGSGFVCGDMREVALPACDVVVILDVLHYVDHAAQEAVLTRVRDALQPRGRLLVRVGDQSSARGFAASQWVDRVVTMIRGHRVPPTFGRPLADWIALLERLGFAVSPVPMSRGTPFANVLLAADLRGDTP
jgi:SAM-dependent methyltransferase